MITLPEEAKCLLAPLEARYGVPVAVMLQPAPKSTPERAARRAAIQALANEKVDGLYRWTQDELGGFFSVSRQSIHRLRSLAPGYEPRQKQAVAP